MRVYFVLCPRYTELKYNVQDESSLKIFKRFYFLAMKLIIFDIFV